MKLDIIKNKEFKIREKKILLDPKGKQFTQAKAKSLAKYDRIVLISGHYKGVDERVAGKVVAATIVEALVCRVGIHLWVAHSDF